MLESTTKRENQEIDLEYIITGPLYIEFETQLHTIRLLERYRYKLIDHVVRFVIRSISQVDTSSSSKSVIKDNIEKTNDDIYLNYRRLFSSWYLSYLMKNPNITSILPLKPVTITSDVYYWINRKKNNIISFDRPEQNHFNFEFERKLIDKMQQQLISNNINTEISKGYMGTYQTRTDTYWRKLHPSEPQHKPYLRCENIWDDGKCKSRSGKINIRYDYTSSIVYIETTSPTVGNTVVKIRFEKLFKLFLRYSKQKPYDSNKFIVDLFLLHRLYYALDEKNNALSIPPGIISLMGYQWGELFGSPLNIQSEIYCSPFPMDTLFGSQGSFFNYELQNNRFYIANPPFDDSIMTTMAERLISQILKYPSTIVIVILPVWDSKTQSKIGIEPYNICFKALELLNQYAVYSDILDKRYQFYNYSLAKYISVCPCHLLQIQNTESEDNTNYLTLMKRSWIQSLKDK